MTFESLREALDPKDPSLTVEGWPSPRRVVVLANAP
jgi:tRNA (mo5U34)-methyltransferase